MEDNIKQIKEKLNEIVNEFEPKIGTLGEDDYNADLDDICCHLLDLKALF